MNLNAGKAYRARLGFAGLLGAVVVVVAGKAAAGHGEQAAAAISMPGATTGAPQPTSSQAPSPTVAAAATASPATVGTPTATTGVGTVSGSTGAASSTPRTVVGDVEDTHYGPVQVELIVAGGKITNVIALQLPNQERRDIEISSQAVPILRQEVLAAQSAKIDAVSGASFTSSGYAWSVQSAIDKAGL
ncbi:FMN-binding protein [Frankia sp. AgB1.9]|uniref:FMN-binding protein n=1 Tax=unclassified Frankia TaxID=2632575 RepID=UPI0019311AAD|nr:MULTISPECIES: FMN-binding protein [unclassified Frankia]MBL7488021.1 FMN-binding protein [Frankia sp. AgW1.1]MBL7549459.1 FMN-binding protein [Frankia sp. AgB1.9]MBL7619925.1 FMN-binding protein [Frankia sp. AgB1.8]